MFGVRPPLPGRGLDPAFALPVGFVALLVLASAATEVSASVRPVVLPAGAAIVVAAVAVAAAPAAAAPLAVMGWLTVAGFTRPPYGQLQAAGSGRAAVVILAAAAGGASLGTAGRRLRDATAQYRRLPPGEVTLDVVTGEDVSRRADGVVVPRPRRSLLTAGDAPAVPRGSGLSRRRQLTGLALTFALLPALTAGLSLAGPRLALVDDLLLYLLAVSTVTLVGGFWPAVLAAVAASLLLNWFFTPPLHTWTIEAPQNIFALLLFVTVAVTVSSVVHLAAQRAALAAARSSEAHTLLTLARTVLAGDDTPTAILDHMAGSLGVTAQLWEQTASGWVRVAGPAATSGPALTVPAGERRQLRVFGTDPAVSRRVLDGFAAQAAAALDRDRLRVQAAQAEALAAANRMRTALLAAVSHDLRTPLASVKAAVTTLRQTDVAWSANDRAELLATIEEGTDRLTGLIANLLDMSRIHTGALQPMLRPTALEEVVPLVARDLIDPAALRLDLPDDLPLVAADPGLLERALANLVANAVRYSPAGRPPTLTLAADGDALTARVVDHGPGVPDDQLERIFAPFQQLGDQRTGTGVGLGLAVARGFVEAMGGRLTASATPGGGLTMTVRLPAARAQPADERAGAAP